MLVTPAQGKQPVRGLCRSKPSPLPLTSLLELDVLPPLTFTRRLLCRRIRISLACSTGSVSPGRVCLLYAGPCMWHHIDRCWRWDHPSLSPQQHPFTSACISQGPLLPVTILPSYGDKLVNASMRGGDGGKKPKKEDGTPNSASLCKIAQAIMAREDWDASLLVQVTHQPSAATLSKMSSASVPLPALQYFTSAPSSYINHAINRNHKPCSKSHKPTKVKSPTNISGSWDNSVTTRGEAGFRQE